VTTGLMRDVVPDPHQQWLLQPVALPAQQPFAARPPQQRAQHAVEIDRLPGAAQLKPPPLRPPQTPLLVDLVKKVAEVAELDVVLSTPFASTNITNPPQHSTSRSRSAAAAGPISSRVSGPCCDSVGTVTVIAFCMSGSMITGVASAAMEPNLHTRPHSPRSPPSLRARGFPTVSVAVPAVQAHPPPVPPGPGLPPAQTASRAPLYLGLPVTAGSALLLLVLVVAVLSSSSGNGPSDLQRFTPAFQAAYVHGYKAGQRFMPHLMRMPRKVSAIRWSTRCSVATQESGTRTTDGWAAAKTR
jgi:hypothetical protein